MSQSTINLHSLMNEEAMPFYTVMAVFPASYTRGDEKVPVSRPYMYKVPKEFALEEGDFIAVQTGESANLGTVKVAQIVEVHPDDQIDYSSDILVKWIVDVVDLSAYITRRKKDREVLDSIKVEQRKRLKQSLIQAFENDPTALLNHTSSGEE